MSKLMERSYVFLKMGKVVMRYLPVLACFVFGFIGCGRMDAILYDPPLTPGQMLNSMPFVKTTFLSRSIVLMEPSSTFFVYLLGLLTIGCGIYFLRIRDNHISRFWWGAALIFWGLGAMCAGTSYQIFSYELKCAGREFCLWTSWWEVIYLVLSTASLNAMVMAQANACARGGLRRLLAIYAAINMLIYTCVALSGALIPNKFMISFELMILFVTPNIVIFLILNARRYLHEKNRIDLFLLGTWLGLVFIVAVYFVYLIGGVTEVLWKKGIWFSANDVLHIMLIVWMLYIAKCVAPKISDLPGRDV